MHSNQAVMEPYGGFLWGPVADIGCFSLLTMNDMEKHRAESFFTKEPETVEWIRSFTCGKFLDVGANVGVYSLFAAGLHKKMTVYSFEPVFQNYSRLLDNIRVNSFSNIKPFHCAIGNRTGLTNLYLPTSGVADSGAQIDEPVNDKNERFNPSEEQLCVQTTVDALFSLVGNIDYIKIDVDGRESTILGAAKLALQSARSVLVECNTDRLSLANLSGFMKEHRQLPDPRFNNLKDHSSNRRGGNPVNVVFTNAALINTNADI